MSARLVGLTVYSSVLFNPGGTIRRWADRVERRFTENATALAPINKRFNKGFSPYPPGSLKASISGSVERIAPKALETIISVDVPYALYVLKGTSTITAGEGGYLFVPKNPGFGMHTRHQFVSGQRANDFLGLAHLLTARSHPSIGRGTLNAFKSG